MARESEVSTATAADIAADMERHRSSYRAFLKVMTYAAAGVGVVLVILFFMMN